MENYIKNITKRIISEEIDNRIFDIENKIFENKNMKKQVCSECGGKMYEGECMECGSMYEGDIQELGGMDDSHPFFGRKNLRDIPKKDIERFFKNREEDEYDDDIDYGNTKYGLGDDDDEEYKDRSMYDPYYGDDDDMDDDEEEYYPELRIHHDMPSYKTKYRHSDDEEEKYKKNRNGDIDEEECVECGPMYENFKAKGRIGKLKTKIYPSKLKHGVTETDNDELSDGWMHEDDYEGFTDGRRRIDKAKPYGKITGADFKALRSMKKEVEETLYELDLEEEDVEEGNAFSGALSSARKRGDKTFRVGNKTYPVEESYITEKWKGDVEVEKTGEYSDMTIDEIDNEIKKIKKRNLELKKLGKKVPSSSREKMGQLYFAKRAKKDWPGKGKTKVEESRLIFTENEMISLIENIVLEEKRKKSNKADTYLKSSLSQSKKQEEDYIDSVVKKMKSYLKTGSKGKYEMSPKNFPKGNGELEKMDKMAYVPSKTVDEYITNYTAASLENLDYDNFQPNEERVSKYIKGSSDTGNNPKWANAVETPVNAKRDEVRKNNYLSKLKRKAYNKSPQPVISDKSGSESGADKIMMKLESKDKENILTEMKFIKDLMVYNRKTQ